MIGSYGARDRSLRKAPRRLEEALRANGIDHDVKVYTDAGHSFLNNHDPTEMSTIFRVLVKLSGLRVPRKLGTPRPQAHHRLLRRALEAGGRVDQRGHRHPIPAYGDTPSDSLKTQGCFLHSDDDVADLLLRLHIHIRINDLL